MGDLWEHRPVEEASHPDPALALGAAFIIVSDPESEPSIRRHASDDFLVITLTRKNEPLTQELPAVDSQSIAAVQMRGGTVKHAGHE
ncbi:hypothetical protein Q7C36_004887 [Tachysurus vachellii]|uniref:Uncharacterized protein n=1 Tax=Tachysurus vachellii TaxID=175792 RepID=A0AA88NJA3_TACVA|nr:hypothetical protein Q7C36_004887 [Tachysurus vachellii]